MKKIVLMPAICLAVLCVSPNAWSDPVPFALSPQIATNAVGTSHTVCASFSNPVLIGVAVTFNVTNGPNATVHGTAVTDTNGVACFTYVGTGGIGTDIIDASFVDTNGTRQSTYVLKLWVSPPSSILLLPQSATNVVGTAHTVCASFSNPVLIGVPVAFNVTNGPNATVHGTAVTDTNGVACFTYVGTGGVGTDIIDVSFFDAHTNRQSTFATKLWVQPCTNPVQVAVYSGHTLNGGGTPYSGLVGTFTSSAVSFATDTGYNWHPFGLAEFGADITGTLEVAAAGTYSFILNSDDGSLLYIDGNLVLNNGGTHTPTLTSGSVNLSAGQHVFEVQFFECCGGPSGVDLGLPAGVSYACVVNHPPLAKCKDVTVAANSNCVASASIDDGSFDPDAGDTITVVQVPPGPYPLGTNIVCLVVTDSHGASNACCAVVSVVDLTPPTIHCPGNITAANDPGQCSAVVNFVVSATDNCSIAHLSCDPPPGSVFPVGTTTVRCTAIDAATNSSSCSFTVAVEDREGPVVACRPATNPSDKNIPVAGKNPSSGQNPDGYYQLLARDNCDPNPSLYVHDTASSFVAGPYRSGDIVKLTQNPGGTPFAEPGPPSIVAHLHLKGDALVYAVDASGNTSPDPCLAKMPPKPK